jgi:hypothetical protein
MELIAQFDEGTRRYSGGLLDYDSSLHFKLSHDALFCNETWLLNHQRSFESLDDEVQSAISRAGRYLSLTRPSPDGVLQYYKLIRDRNVKLRNDVGTFETKSARDAKDIRALVDTLNAFLDGWESSRPADKSVDYIPGSISASDWYKDATDRFYAAFENRANRQEALWIADCRLANYEYGLVYEAELAEAAAAREKQGWIAIAIAAVAIVLAVVVIVVTLGAAAPIIAAGGTAALASGAFTALTVAGGTAYIGYNASNLYEGIGDVHYGGKGDVTTPAFNPGRDFVFGGNQQAWDTFGTVSGVVMSVGSAGVGIVSAGTTAANLGSTFTRGAAVGAGKMVITTAVGTSAGYGGTLLGNEVLGEEWGWTVGLALGIGTSALTVGGLNKLDTKFNLSGINQNPTAMMDTPEGQGAPKTQADVEAPPFENAGHERSVKNTFAKGECELATYKEGDTLYRVGSDNGSYWSTDPPPQTEYQWRVDNAIKQEFCNDASTLYKIDIPEGSTLSGYSGTIGSQGAGLYGGSQQVYIDYRAVPPDWIQTSPMIWG